MRLTQAQRRVQRRGTPSERKAMDLLVALGEIYGADRLIPITSAHVAGASYKIVGDAGREFLEAFSETARVKVPTTVNPVGMDLTAWKETGIPSDFADQQRRIVEAYRRMGVRETWSCIPYQVGNRPGLGEHVAWAESSAAIFANAVLGARTNREGGPSALAAAVTGWTPDYGLHREENRVATTRVRLTVPIKGYEFALLGHHLGRRLGGGIPYLEGMRGTEDELKALGAALATSSDITVFHVQGMTPEWEAAGGHELEVLEVGAEDLAEAKADLLTTEDYEIVAFGCPQLSEGELAEVADLMQTHRPTVPVWVFTSRDVAQRAEEAVARIRGQGGRVVLDTCPEVTPLNLIARDVGTASAKAAVYLPTLSGQRVHLDDHEELLRRRRPEA